MDIQKEHSDIISLSAFKKMVVKQLNKVGMTISELARQTNINQSTLHKGLFGKRELTFSNASTISDLLGLPLLKQNKPDNTTAIPIIYDLEQLPWLDEVNKYIWDEYTLIESVHECIALDSSLFAHKIFPQRSILIVRKNDFEGKNMIYLNDGVLSLYGDNKSALGTLAEIIFREKHE